jgi:hypothetical protein
MQIFTIWMSTVPARSRTGEDFSSLGGPLLRRGWLGLEAEAAKELVDLSLWLRPVVTEQCRANQSLQMCRDDLSYNFGLKLGRQFTGSLGGFQWESSIAISIVNRPKRVAAMTRLNLSMRGRI